jgi:hypothetical protein
LSSETLRLLAEATASFALQVGWRSSNINFTLSLSNNILFLLWRPLVDLDKHRISDFSIEVFHAFLALGEPGFIIMAERDFDNNEWMGRL